MKFVIAVLILAIILIAGCAQTTVSKPTYYCDNSNGTFCQNLLVNCTNSILTTNTDYMSLSIDVTNKNSTCQIIYNVTGTTANATELQNASMTCNFPITSGKVAANQDYCKGSLRDIMIGGASNQ